MYNVCYSIVCTIYIISIHMYDVYILMSIDTVANPRNIEALDINFVLNPIPAQCIVFMCLCVYVLLI